MSSLSQINQENYFKIISTSAIEHLRFKWEEIRGLQRGCILQTSMSDHDMKKKYKLVTVSLFSMKELICHTATTLNMRIFYV